MRDTSPVERQRYRWLSTHGALRTRAAHTKQGCDKAQLVCCLSGHFSTQVGTEQIAILSPGTHLQPLPHNESLKATYGPAPWIQDDLCQRSHLECRIRSVRPMNQHGRTFPVRKVGRNNSMNEQNISHGRKHHNSLMRFLFTPRLNYIYTLTGVYCKKTQ